MDKNKAGYSILAALVIAGVTWAWLFVASGQHPDKTMQKEEHKPVTTLYEKDIYLVTLDDGTRCAVISGLSSAGIDCDWQTNNKVTDR